MAEEATSASSRPTSEGGRGDEVAELREEILRLRDLLIAKDAELGVAKGQLAELSQHAARYVMAARSLRGFVPGLARRVAALIRRRG